MPVLNRNIRQSMAIEAKNKKRLLALNPNLDEESGIYFLTREDENGIRYAYIGQAVHILQRLASHLTGYQHIDLSLKKHGLYSVNNIYGWKVGFLHFSKEQLDEKEQYFIRQYALNGYQLRNKTSGSQGAGKEKIDDFKPARGYYDGLKQGRKNLARELSSIASKHLSIHVKAEKAGNKVSEKQFEKFMSLIDENSYKDGDETT